MRTETSDPGSPPIGRLPKIVRFVLTISIATVFGPLIGSVAVVMATRLLHSGFSGGMNDLSEHAAAAVMFGYMMGWKIAFVAGTIVAVAAIWRPPTFLTIIAATVVANVVCQVALQDGIHPWLNFNLAVSIFAATVCWLLFRRLLSSP